MAAALSVYVGQRAGLAERGASSPSRRDGDPVGQLSELDELADISYRSGDSNPESSRIQPLHERARWEIDTHYQAARMILAAGYSKQSTKES